MTRILTTEERALLQDLGYYEQLMADAIIDRDEAIQKLVDMGISCRVIGQYTNLSYRTIHKNYYRRNSQQPQDA